MRSPAILGACVGILAVARPASAVDWYATYSATYPKGIAPTTTEGGIGWGEAYDIRSFISMYRAAKARGEPAIEQEKFLGWIVQHCDNLVNNHMRARASDGTIYLVLEGHGFAPMARFIRMVFDDPALYAAYHSQANAYLSYLEGTIVPAWRGDAYWGDPHNWYASYGTMLIYLAQISRSPRYRSPDYATPDGTLAAYYESTVRDMATKYFADFGWTFAAGPMAWWRQPFPANKGLCYVSAYDAYVWRYMDPDTTPRPEDDHSNLEVEFLLEAVNDATFAGAYPKSILPRVGRTMTRLIWANADESNPVFHTHIVEPTFSYGEVIGFHTFRWMWLYDQDPQIGKLSSNFYAMHPTWQISEVMANLACWQAGLRIDEPRPTDIADAGPAADANVADAPSMDDHPSGAGGCSCRSADGDADATPAFMIVLCLGLRRRLEQAPFAR